MRDRETGAAINRCSSSIVLEGDDVDVESILKETKEMESRILTFAEHLNKYATQIHATSPGAKGMHNVMNQVIDMAVEHLGLSIPMSYIPTKAYKIKMEGVEEARSLLAAMEAN